MKFRITKPMNIKTNILTVACTALLTIGCTRVNPPKEYSDEAAYNVGVKAGATAAVNVLMERLFKNKSLTITLSDKEIESIRVEAINSATIGQVITNNQFKAWTP